MTPERIAEIADFHTVSLAVKPRMERAIRQAVNEALEEAAKACIDALSYDDYDPGSSYAEVVRALKIPEAP